MNEKSTFYNKDQFYTFTLAPHDKYQFFGKDKRFSMFINHYNEFFLKYPTYKIDICLNIELSEKKDIQYGSSGSRLHLHGIIKFNSNKAIKKFLLHLTHELSLQGRTEIDTIKDKFYWYDYCQKQQEIIDHDTIGNIDWNDYLLIVLPDELAEEGYESADEHL